MTTASRERPQKPAIAYHLMAQYLPQSYFEKAPPKYGIRFFVTGTDGVETVWDIPAEESRPLELAIKIHPLCRRLQVKAYDERTGR